MRAIERNAIWSFILALTLVSGAVGCRSIASANRDVADGEIRAVLNEQVRDWNDGSIERFMRGYANSDDSRFASGAEVVRGWQTVLERYRTRYPDRAAMGRLTFSDLDITVLSADAALVLGRWHLKRAQDEPSGLFTLVFRKLADGWRIVHDHTSVGEKK